MGVLRLGEQPGEFVPANVPEKGDWYYVNVREIAQACGLPPDTPFMEVVAGAALSLYGWVQGGGWDGWVREVGVEGTELRVAAARTSGWREEGRWLCLSGRVGRWDGA